MVLYDRLRCKLSLISTVACEQIVKVMSSIIQPLDQIGENLPAAGVSSEIGGRYYNSPNTRSSQLKSIPQSKLKILLSYQFPCSRRERGARIYWH